MSFRQRFGRRLLKLMGWKAEENKIVDTKCIILGVPHTSVVDFIVAWAYGVSIGITPNIMIKKEFFFWPLGWLLRKMGAIPVDRSKGSNVALHSIQAMKEADTMYLAIAPEGTRKKTDRWKMGFLTIARACDVPVYLGYFDYKTKKVGSGPRFAVSDNPKEDMKRIQAHYAAMHLEGRHKDCFSCGNVEPELIKD
ncbi:MAG: 1-acyl-sn-glycerol-3-phosphate acyltransferase [Bacteroidales bacterium]|nr:1-acyl-sn-glycerol-3-phosphate acyltransferase [Bacteroidales bacterium]